MKSVFVFYALFYSQNLVMLKLKLKTKKNSLIV